MNDFLDTNDYELIMLYRENNEDAKNILFLKYKYIIDVSIKKYSTLIKLLNIDYQEVISECNVGFTDGLNSYDETKDACLKTFLTLCVNRRLMTVLRKYNREKYKVLNDTYSLDYSYDKFKRPLIEVLEDEKKEPLLNLVEEENFNGLINEIKSSLSKQELLVFDLLLDGQTNRQIVLLTNLDSKRVSNTIHRIRVKIKKILMNNELEI